ncbi:PhnD/SsuA/transferrin family substrate-binding protein [Roseofilum sp. BLCC_M91]|uniref:PhnD/SsuA/transferrin family substrate-binding protein n=1 Tax=Roseofilum halophilum BLCC-M91 TaxID=3022259 RepID=A0ABT7BPB3_9CYAN|nr:PhnD/SsuA/transferrin family substrate-binding protein [Roseofilum halophilum]MDJ1181034.1 PhnD/SsuA/transferrin family substrate-binding protein [Roseofilum halophilum BLCC-M91]
MKRRYFLAFSLGLLVSCTANQTSDPSLSNRTPTENSSVVPLKLAISDVQGLENLKRDYEPFRMALEDSLGRSVEFYPVQSYTQVASALQAGSVDLSVVGPSEYVLIRARTNAIPAIAITRPNYHAAIALPPGSPVQSIRDLKGKTIAMVKVGSTSGHLGPTEMFMSAGLDPKTDYEVKMLGREGSLAALKNREVDAWAGPIIDYEDFLEAEGASTDEFRLLKKGPALPSDVLIVNSRTKPQEVENLRDRLLADQNTVIRALASTSANTKYQESTLIAVEDRDYDMIRNVYRAIGEGNFL